jgi:hypothetical protein
MGLFSSKKKTTVGTTAVRVIADADLPNAKKQATTQALFRGGDLLPYMMDALTGGLGFKVERLFEYAATDYVHGLPSGQYLSANAATETTQVILNGLAGAPVTLVYVRFGPLNTLHAGWLAAIAQAGYDPATNILAGLGAPGQPAYLTDLQVVVPPGFLASADPQVVAQWGYSPRAGYVPNQLARVAGLAPVVAFSPLVEDPEATDDYVRLSYVWGAPETEGGSGAVHSATLALPITGYDDAADYVHALYVVDGVPHYWLYQVGSGTYAALDALATTAPVTLGQYFPFVYFRYAKQSTNADPTSADYRTSKKLVKYLGMDYDTVADGINANPDIADVEQAMLMLAVPAVPTHPIEQRYLFDFFAAIQGQAGTTYSVSASPVRAALYGTLGEAPVPRWTTVIQDKRFKLSLSAAGITRTRKAGLLGPIGTHAVRMEPFTTAVPYLDEDSGWSMTQAVPGTRHIYTRQVSSALVDEIVVTDLTLQYHVYGRYAVTADEADAILLIPLDRALTQAYNTAERDTLYARSLHYVFNSRVITKIKWYQTSLFQFIVIVVTIALTIITYGATWQATAAALAAGTLTIQAFLMTVLTGLIEQVVIGAAVKLFVQVAGADLALVAAVVAMAVGGYEALASGSTSTLTTLPYVGNLLQVGTGLASGVSQYLQGRIADLQEGFADLAADTEAATTALQEAAALLEQDTHLSPMTFFGEAPETFFHRTIHSGNIGMMGIDAVSNFVERSLSLPTLPERFGGFSSEP